MPDASLSDGEPIRHVLHIVYDIVYDIEYDIGYDMNICRRDIGVRYWCQSLPVFKLLLASESIDSKVEDPGLPLDVGHHVALL